MANYFCIINSLWIRSRMYQQQVYEHTAKNVNDRESYQKKMIT